MSNPTLASLLSPPTADAIFNALIGYLANGSNGGFPVSDWETGGVERSLVRMEGLALQDLTGPLITAIAAGGFTSLAAGAWLTLLAHERFSLDRLPATFTIGTEVLNVVAGAGPYTIAIGQLWFRADSGNLYTNTTGGVLTFPVPLSITIQSQFANNSQATPSLNYVEPANSITSMVTPLPGVICNNPAAAFSIVTRSGTGTGTVVPSVAVVSHAWAVLITTAGQLGAAFFKLSINGGNTYPNPAIAIPGGGVVANVDATGLTLTFANGAINPSFALNDVYSFNSPGTWYSQQGQDEEGDAALATRCMERWPSLGLVPTLGLYDLWARVATNPPQVSKTKVATSTTILNTVNITLAGSSGPVSGVVVAAVQAYINIRKPLTDRPVVASAAAVAVTIAGLVTVTAAEFPNAPANVQTALQNLIARLPIGGQLLPGSGTTGYVVLAEVEAAIGSVAGFVNLTGLLINAAATDLTLTALQVATLVNSLTYQGL